MTARCMQCGAQLDNEAEPCVACGSEDTAKIFAKGEKGRILGEAAAKFVAPGNPLVSKVMGTMGKLIGRRMAKGHPLISFGDGLLPPAPKKRKRTKRATKALTTVARRKRSRKKP